MGYLIDTSVLIAGLLDSSIDESWSVSVITIGELEAGVLLAADSRARAGRLARLTGVLARAPALPVDRPVASSYAVLREQAGRGSSNDLWIAATALAHDLTLLTSDEGQSALPLVRTRLVSSAG